MGGRHLRVKELARLTGVSVRTLHHYDHIGLLVSSARSASGYRLYDQTDLLRLMQILDLRELGLSLDRIRRTLDDPAFDSREALLELRDLLVERVAATEVMIRSVEAALSLMEGEVRLNPAEMLGGFDGGRHEAEARSRWGGSDAFEESKRRTRRYTPLDWKRIKAEERALMEALAGKLGGQASPGDEAVRSLVEEHRRHVDRWFYPCSPRMHARLASFYTADPRFTASLDRYREGLAEFFAAAIRANAEPA